MHTTWFHNRKISLRRPGHSGLPHSFRPRRRSTQFSATQAFHAVQYHIESLKTCTRVSLSLQLFAGTLTNGFHRSPDGYQVCPLFAVLGNARCGFETRCAGLVSGGLRCSHTRPTVLLGRRCTARLQLHTHRANGIECRSTPRYCPRSVY